MANKEAKAPLVDALADRLTRSSIEILTDYRGLTVAEMMDYWLTTHVVTKKPRTQANYRDEVRRHVVPYLGSRAVQALGPQHIVAWHAALRRDGKSTHAIRMAHQRLQQALDQAAMFGVVPRNVAKIAKPPQLEQRPERPTWTEEQARAAVAELKDATYRVASVERRHRSKSAPPAYITSTLQQEASSRLRFAPKRTMRLAQELYERRATDRRAQRKVPEWFSVQDLIAEPWEREALERV